MQPRTSGSSATGPSLEQHSVIVVRPETGDDAADIDRVVGAAFGSDVEPRLVRLIRDSHGYIAPLSLVAVVGDRVVGHTMLSYVELDDGETRHRALTMSPVAVAPEMQRRGVGSALVRAGLEAADARGEPLVTLEGSPRYYRRFGFRPASEFGVTIDLPDWAAPEAAQVCPLSNYDPAVRGHLIYPPAFAELEQPDTRTAL